MALFQYIVWDADPEIVSLFGRSIRYYGVFFALGFLISREIMIYFYKQEGKPPSDVDVLTVYMIIATVIGARLGHVLFYEPERYLQDPIKILYVWEGGLASHGAAFGILIALYIYSRYDIRIAGKDKPFFYAKKIKREGQNYFQILDRIVIVVALTGAFIRLGNFMNSEIIGKPTQSDYGVVFMHDVTTGLKLQAPQAFEEIDAYQPDVASLPDSLHPVALEITFDRRYQDTTELYSFMKNQVVEALALRSDYRQFVNATTDRPTPVSFKKTDGKWAGTLQIPGIPRHPAQLYESLTSLLIFFLLFFIWSRYKQNLPAGLNFGLFLILLFGLRFFHEFMKENQVAFEEEIPLNMGQWLSIPLVLAGIIVIIIALKKHQTPKVDDKSPQ